MLPGSYSSLLVRKASANKLTTATNHLCMSPQLPPRLPMTPAVPLQVKQFSRFWLVSFPICRYEKAYFFEEFYVHRPAFPSHRSHRSKGGGNARRKF